MKSSVIKIYLSSGLIIEGDVKIHQARGTRPTIKDSDGKTIIIEGVPLQNATTEITLSPQICEELAKYNVKNADFMFGAVSEVSIGNLQNLLVNKFTGKTIIVVNDIYSKL